MDRMKAVREIEGTDNEMSSGFIVSCFIPSHFFSPFSYFKYSRFFFYAAYQRRESPTNA